MRAIEGEHVRVEQRKAFVPTRAAAPGGISPSAIILAAVFPLSGPARGGEKARKPAAGPPSAKQQPLFEKLQVREAWELTKGSPEMLVGVIDNGFDFFHPDLLGQLIPGYYASGGYHTEIMENMGHGTIIAGLIAANSKQKNGISGLAPGCKILTASIGMTEHTLLKLRREFERTHPKATLTDFQAEMMNHGKELAEFGEKWTTYQTTRHAEAIRYLVDHGVKVINISGFLVKKLIVSVDAWNSLEEAFGYAASKDVIIVVAAGNIAQEVEDYPGDEAHTIVAGASTLKDERWEQEMEIKGQKIKQGSCYGKRLTLMAPTEKILECVPHEKRFYECDDSPMGGTKNKFEGMHELFPNGATSSAAPIVTSLVALVRSLRPDLRAESVIEIIKQGCDDIGEKGYDISTGWGRVNFLKTLRLAKDFKQQGPEPSAPTPQPAQQQPREQNDEAR